MKHVSLTLALLLSSLSIKAQQDTIYLDAQMTRVEKRSQATECAVIIKQDKDRQDVHFYTLSGELTRQCQYKEFGKKAKDNTLHGTVRYKFSGSEQDSLMLFYTNNTRNGGATFYYPDGTVKAKAHYKDGLIEGLFQQFYSDGKLMRKEVYKQGKSQGGQLLSPEGTELPFTPFYKEAVFSQGEDALMQLLSRSVKLPDAAMTSGQTYFTATVLLSIDEQGKFRELTVVKSTHSLFDASCFKKAEKALKKETFIPGEVEGKPAASTILSQEITIAMFPSTRVSEHIIL